MTDDKRLPDYPSADDREFGYQVAQTALSAASAAVPGAGYALQQIVKRIVASPLDARRAKWFQSVGKALQELQDRLEGFDPERLEQNEEFISTVYEATEIAMRTHRETKRQALCNALKNVALGHTLDEVVRGSFLTYIDRFSDLHIRLLRLLANPSGSIAMKKAANGTMMGGQEAIVRAEINEQEAPLHVFDRVVSDLMNEGLIGGNLKGMVSQASLLAKRTTPIGDSFLQFISEPIEQ
jgi:hypothetical protein